MKLLSGAEISCPLSVLERVGIMDEVFWYFQTATCYKGGFKKEYGPKIIIGGRKE